MNKFELRELTSLLKPKYCSSTGKVKYDKKGALSAKNKRYNEEHVNLRIYPCPDCKMWHLTSQIHEKN